METKKQQSTFAPSTNATGRIPGTKKTKAMIMQTKREVKITIEDNPNELGKQHFSMECLGMIGYNLEKEGIKRQCFFGNLDEHVKRFREKEWKIEIISCKE